MPSLGQALAASWARQSRGDPAERKGLLHRLHVYKNGHITTRYAIQTDIIFLEPRSRYAKYAVIVWYFLYRYDELRQICW